MKQNIHPNYVESTVSCACGSTFKTRSTKPVLKLDICSSCHPFFTGRQKFVDTAGRVERFQKRFEKVAEAVEKKQTQPKLAKGQAGVAAKKKNVKIVKILTSAPTKAKAAPGAKPAAEKAAAPAKAH